MKRIAENLNTETKESYDVVVCGAGPAGIMAALSSARTGAKTLLLEVHGCLGGVWTAGNLSWIADSKKQKGIMAEIVNDLDKEDARREREPGARDFAYDVEVMKRILDRKTVEEGVDVQFHTRVCAAVVDSDKRITHVITESKSGREAWQASIFIDTTGDGDLGALAGCRYSVGHPVTGEVQPLSMTAIVTGIQAREIAPFIGGGVRAPKDRLREEMESAGVSPSYSCPILFRVYEDLFGFIPNHQYGVPATDARGISKATIEARQEIYEIVRALRAKGGIWANMRIVATGSQIGVREGRRLKGLYEVEEEDLISGARHDDAVCRGNFGIDVHSLSPKSGKDYDPVNKKETVPYDIPLRALIAADVKGLMMAGRCISGDFIAHSSYRVTGNAAAMGEAAGVTAALAAAHEKLPQELSWNEIEAGISELSHAPA